MARLLGSSRMLLRGVVGRSGATGRGAAAADRGGADRGSCRSGTRRGRSYPRDARVHELFEAQAAETPDAVAVVFEGRSADATASSTRGPTGWRTTCASLGVGPETLVASACERSLEMVVGLLGILKAGGAYVPLDPEYPQERLAFMLGTRARRWW